MLQYCIYLMESIQCYLCHLDWAFAWWEARGQTMMHYQVHLDEGGPADSLEVLLVSLALDTPINVIMSDEVWCTARSGLDFQYSIVVLTWGGTRLCKVEDSDQYLGDIDTSAEKATDSVKDEDCVPQPLLEHPKGGHPLAKSHLDSSRPTAIFNNSESSLSDIDSLFVADFPLRSQNPNE